MMRQRTAAPPLIYAKVGSWKWDKVASLHPTILRQRSGGLELPNYLKKINSALCFRSALYWSFHVYQLAGVVTAGQAGGRPDNRPTGQAASPRAERSAWRRTAQGYNCEGAPKVIIARAHAQGYNCEGAFVKPS